MKDPCKDPTITVPNAATLTYVITDEQDKYTLSPKFSVTPDFCPFEITATVNGIDITFDTDTQEITIPAILDDLTPSNPKDDGSRQYDYPVVP